MFSYGSITQKERETLHNEVWTSPLKTVAEKYGVSDSTLRKYCIKFSVPLPPRGYWGKVEKGENPNKRELPKVTGELRKLIRNYVIQYKKDLEEFSDEELKNGEGLFLLTDDTKSCIQKVISEVEVKNQLRSPHPLIAEHREEMPYRKKRDREIERASFSVVHQNKVRSQFRENKGVLPIHISSNQLNRAYRIMDALIKALMELEGNVSVGYDSQLSKDIGSISVMRNYFSFEITEVERKRKSKEDDDREETLKSLKLTLTTTGLWEKNNEERLEFRDNVSLPLEKQLDQVILSMFINANKIAASDELYSRELERKWEEEERQRQIKQLKKQEQEKLGVLEAIISDWEYAQKLRRFAAELEMKIDLIEIESDRNQIIEWLKWMHEKADWIDPITAKEDKLIGKRHNMVDILKKFDL